MDLYATDSTGVVNHYAQKPTFENNPYGNTYAISSLRAEEYTLTIGNPGYTGDTLNENSLQFIKLPAESVSSRPNDAKAPESTYTSGYQKSTTATIKIDANADNVTNNRMIDIGLQRPHKVTFQVVYEDKYDSAPAAPELEPFYVWHGESASAPTFTLDSDFQWEDDSDPTWTASDGATEYGQPIASTGYEITYTATAVRKPHTVTYDLNGGDGSITNETAVNGQTVDLKCVGEDTITVKPTHAQNGDKNVVFIGWTVTPREDILERGETKQTAEELGANSTVTMGTADVTVYALWGYDENNNGIADALEDRYTLTYDENGGSSTPPAVVGNLIEEQRVPLDPGTDMIHAEEEGKTVLFLGWAENIPEKIYSKEDYNTRTIVEGTLKETVTMPADNKTVYAVWGYDENHNGTLDYEEGALYGIEYKENGGSRPAGLTEAQNMHYLPETEVKLWQPPDGSPWTKGSKEAGTQAVFVGWCTTDHGETPVKTKPTDLITAARTPNGGAVPQNTTVYAAWAEDRNGNNTPDYEETQITIQYNLNEGTGIKKPEDMTGLVKGASYVLADGRSLKRNDSDHPGHPAVFVGWSRTQYGIVPQDAGETGSSMSEKPVLVSNPYTIPAEATETTITLYAVYGVDDNDDGKADYIEDAQHVEYYPNGGKKTDGTDWPLDEPFRECNHHHVSGENVELMSVSAMADMISRGGAVLVGWSKEAQKDLLETKPADGLLITTVTIPESGNAKVYAVWAADINGNHIPDYEDPHYNHTYYYNSALTDWRYTDGDKDPSDNVGVNPDGVSSIEYENNVLPDHTSNILLDTCIDLAEPVLKTRTDKAEDGTVVHRYVQIGWSGYCHPAPVSREQANQWLLEANDEDKVRSGIQRKIAGPAFQFAFAVWALDENDDGIADFDEGRYDLRYDLNGGSGTRPEDITRLLPGVEVALDDEAEPVRDKALFLGWSEAPHDPVTSQSDADGWLVKTVTMPKESSSAGNNVITVYALWAANENAGDGTDDAVKPDYEESHSLTYAPNPLGGEVSNMPSELSHSYPYGTDVTMDGPIPVHNNMSGRKVVFVGWSTEQVNHVLEWDDDVPPMYSEGDHVKIGASNITLYAVWAYDDNGDGIPDYRESRGNLQVTKTVSGAEGDQNREWHFRVELDNAGINGQYGEMFFTDGVAEFTLKHGQSVTARDLPEGIAYAVTELEENQDGYATTYTDDRGWIVSGQDMVAAFLNDRPAAASPDNPSGNPSDNPSGNPSDNPSGGSSDNPSGSPSDNPSGGIPGSPSGNPSDNPSGGTPGSPSENPSDNPSGGTPGSSSGSLPANPSGGLPENPSGSPSESSPADPSGGSPENPSGSPSESSPANPSRGSLDNPSESQTEDSSGSSSGGSSDNPSGSQTESSPGSSSGGSSDNPSGSPAESSPNSPTGGSSDNPSGSPTESSPDNSSGSQPESSADGSSGESSVNNPATGDYSQMGLWITLMLISLIGIALSAASLLRRKEQ